MKKINLKDFTALKLTINEKLNIKGGSGCTQSRRVMSHSCGGDADNKTGDNN